MREIDFSAASLVAYRRNSVDSRIQLENDISSHSGSLVPIVTMGLIDRMAGDGDDCSQCFF